MPRWLTSTEAAKYIGVSIATIRRWSDSKLIPHWITPGGQRRYSEEALDDWLDERQTGS